MFLIPIESSTEEEATKDDDTATDSSEDSDSDVSASTASDSSVTESRSGSSPSSMSKESQPSTRRRRVSSSYSGKILFYFLIKRGESFWESVQRTKWN